MSTESRIHFSGGAGEVTGSNFLFEGNFGKILIDCGLVQGGKFAEKENRASFPYDPKTIDILFVTHAHLDHIGRIPKLVREGFRGRIFSTPATKALAEVMLPDALSILLGEARREKEEPLYTGEDIERALSLWEELPYHEEKNLSEGVSVHLRNAGHILGSAMVIFTRKDGNKEKKIAFSGDLGNSPSLLLPDTESVSDVDYLLMESVYGDKNHESKEERNEHFKEAILKVISRGGTLLIPAFSLERTQNILYLLNNLVEEKEVPKIPVFVDSPLATKVTEIYSRFIGDFNESIRKEIREGDDIFKFPRLSFTVSRFESEDILHHAGAKIILAGSGMSEGGRVRKHEKILLPDPKNLLLLVGYQPIGTLGRRFEEREKKVFIDGVEVAVKAEVEAIKGFSSHKDSDHLLAFAGEAQGRVKKIFVCMGEPKASLFLSQRIRDEYDIDASAPEAGSIATIDF